MQVRSRTNMLDAEQGDEKILSHRSAAPSRPFVQLPNHSYKSWSIRSGQAFIVHHYQYYAVKLGSQINLHISCAGNASPLFQSATVVQLGPWAWVWMLSGLPSAIELPASHLHANFFSLLSKRRQLASYW
jgi:hypothetical protein